MILLWKIQYTFLLRSPNVDYDYQITATNHSPNATADDSGISIEVTCLNTQQKVGRVDFEYGGGVLTGLSPEVAESHRRRGIATAMYDAAEFLIQAKAEPDAMLSNDGKEFWTDRLKKRALTGQELVSPILPRSI